MTINMSDLVHQWQDQKLVFEDVHAKVLEYSRYYKMELKSSDVMYVAKTLMNACDIYHGKGNYNEFLVALATDSLRIIMYAGDNRNIRCLQVYYTYLYNCAPGDWREKLK